jgi:hypothetical protein
VVVVNAVDEIVMENARKAAELLTDMLLMLKTEQIR